MIRSEEEKTLGGRIPTAKDMKRTQLAKKHLSGSLSKNSGMWAFGKGGGGEQGREVRKKEKNIREKTIIASRSKGERFPSNLELR